MPIQRPRGLTLTLAATATSLCLMLAACGGGSGTPFSSADDAGGSGTPPPPTVPPAVEPAAACAALNGASATAAELSLPSGGASVASATFITADAPGNTLGNYCQVRGVIQPLDATASVINFAVNLPSNWNGKAIHFGGGGFNGRLIDGTEPIRFGPADKPAPLALGYATYGDDSGHQSSSITDGRFAMNDEELANYGGNSLKKTHDVAARLIRARYGKNPTKAYFLGTSTGGRDALAYIQRWPADYDGVIANEPALNYSGTRLSNLAVGRALYLNGGAGWVNVAKTLLVQKTVLGACDRLDGAADGIISNVESCRQLNTQILNSLRCAGGADTGNTCLSDAQLATIRTIESPLEFTRYRLANNVTRAGGYNLLEGALVAGPYTTRDLGTRSVPGNPATSSDANMYVTGDQWAKYFVTRVPGLDSLTFDPLDPGAYTQRVQAVSALTDATQPDLSAFLSRGGRLIMLHGLADEVISPNSTIDYFQRVIATVGQAAVDQGVRFYTVPGMGHGTGVFIPNWDSLAALENWVERGLAPATMVAYDAVAGTYGRTRPLCHYPAYPKYKGSGSLDAAVNYSCVADAGDPLACANLPVALTEYKGGNTRGEELTLAVDPTSLKYTITFTASLQRSAGTQRTGSLFAQGHCSYASAESGALFTFGAGGLVHGGVAAASGGGYLPLIAFRDTFANATVGSGFNSIATDYNAIGVDYSATGTATPYAGTGKIRNAGTWQTCQAAAPAPGFIMYDANCSPAGKGYLQFDATRRAFDLKLTSTCGGAGCPSTPTTGGTVTGSIVVGLVGGSPVPLVLTRGTDGSSGLRLYAKQATSLSGGGDGSYTLNSTDGGTNQAASVVGSAFSLGASGPLNLSYDTPVLGVAQTDEAQPGYLLFNSGAAGYFSSGASAFLLGVRN
ncbi:tannase/feruloyl esterase family alpha/beta hydrolase [Variovorax terrae]|uniref:Tannase/feruloyl esterase family alpha/beta hydrolase n=1 Tax=Variovorax terrae TaxID=2923278 RepID=A0A9X2ALS4_9BURK|nr:tannase/feruloyl esterase family alpha/beta hydrolase [Variovorax terrae]MCJ0762604.1 tannase/feruloyl esterase family alpha/beta hydrolase [Variovorax terrae]